MGLEVRTFLTTSNPCSLATLHAAAICAWMSLGFGLGSGLGLGLGLG